MQLYTIPAGARIQHIYYPEYLGTVVGYDWADRTVIKWDGIEDAQAYVDPSRLIKEVPGAFVLP